jgi:hypothetical protein
LSGDDSSRAVARRGAAPSIEGATAAPPEQLGSSGGWDPYGLGERPIRAAVEDGWPTGQDRGEPTAVVARGGTLYRVALDSGAVLQMRRRAFREDDGRCHAIPLGPTFGFVCSASTGATSVHEFEPTFETREVARFASARTIVASGNGGFVVRGTCSRDGPATTGADAAFCFFAPSGEERQWKSPAAEAESAAIRPVVLRDGRAAFVVPPTEDSDGKLYVSRGAGFDVVRLASSDPKTPLRHLHLLEGIEERDRGVLGAWALIGEELRGVVIAIDGKVTVGLASSAVDRTLDRTSVAGRFGFDWVGSGRGFETIDGGMHWTPVDLPALDPSPIRPNPVAACGPVGCAKDNWLRIGWGTSAAAADLAEAPAPQRSHVALAPARGVSLRCQPTGEITGPALLPEPKLVAGAARLKPGLAPPGALPAGVRGLPRMPFAPFVPPVARLSPIDLHPSSAKDAPSWTPFRGQAPPSLAPSEVALESGTDPPMTAQARIYTWGARGSDWSHSGHVQARFDDRFEMLGVHSTSVAPAPWLDEDRASDALGLTAGQGVNWSVLLEPSGAAAVLVGQRGAGRADLYAAAAGEPLVVWRDADNGVLPVPASVVRIGPTWFFLHSSLVQGAWSTYVYRVDGGVARRFARLPRVPAPAGEFAPKLMRRALSNGLGILVQGAPGFDQVIRDWYVLSIDPETGELDEPVRLYGSDLEGQIPGRCPEDRDGWMVNTDLSLSPAARIVGPAGASLSSIELRLRLDPGSVCVDAIAARVEGLRAPPNASFLAAAASAHRAPSPASDGLVMSATEASSGRRWRLRCGP